jgi:alkylation response protein AidB-like acyl-CoA dehydrogenase
MNASGEVNTTEQLRAAESLLFNPHTYDPRISTTSPEDCSGRPSTGSSTVARKGFWRTTASVSGTRTSWSSSPRSALNTVNVGKFNVGFASVGMCEHAMYEAVTHAHNRILYGERVTDFPHVRRSFVDAYARLIAMKVFGDRASTTSVRPARRIVATCCSTRSPR